MAQSVSSTRPLANEFGVSRLEIGTDVIAEICTSHAAASVQEIRWQCHHRVHVHATQVVEENLCHAAAKSRRILLKGGCPVRAVGMLSNATRLGNFRHKAACMKKRQSLREVQKQQLCGLS